MDWATAEALAWGTLLLEGVPVRLSGQDSGRGTFSQRHAVFYDVRTGKEYAPLQALAPAGVRFEVHDSLLSEAAVMGFEFGYAVAEHRALVMWEAQFGDFFNGAQVIVDQFLAGSEQKWGQPHGLVLLLPARARGTGSRALERAHRALPDPVRGRQHAGVLSVHARVVFPSAAPAGPRSRREAADRLHAQEPAPPSRAACRRCRSWRRDGSSRCSTTRRPTPARVRRIVMVAGQALLRPAQGDARTRRRTTSRWCGWSSSTRSRRPSSRASSPATRRPPRSCGPRRSRATWAPGASSASSSSTAP